MIIIYWLVLQIKIMEHLFISSFENFIKRFSSNYLKIKKKHFYNWMLYKYIKMLIDYKLMSFNIIEEASNILYKICFKNNKS
jgi:hypothetical protein